MHDQERAELARLKQEQQALQSQIEALRSQIDKLDARLEVTQPSSTPDHIAPMEISALEIAALDLPGEPPKPVLSSTPTAIPPIISEVEKKSAETLETLLKERQERQPTPPPIETSPAPPVVSVPFSFSSPQATPPVAPPPEKASFEMQLGTYWLVRVGIVVLLTGLVFLGNYAYQNWAGLLGAAGKVALLYFAGALLLGAGAWLQRKREKEALKNYGQVLFAGGLAAVYFVTYAAHYVTNLRIIESAVLDGILLLAWAGVIVGIAERKKSELLALFAIGLAYYTSAITHIGSFTLYSNLILTVACVFFLIRNRWATLSFAAIIANYLGFAFWRFHRNEMGFIWPTDEVLKGNWFLAGYWILFTIAVFLARFDKIKGAARVAFVTFNNGAFFGLAVLSMWQAHRGGFWKFSLGLGLALLALAALAKKILPDEPQTKNAYLTQGLLLVTLGLITHFTGFKLSLLLAVESVVLLFAGHQTKNLISISAAHIVAGLAVAFGLFAEPSTLLGSAVAALIACNSVLDRRLGKKIEDTSLSGSSVFFAALAFLMMLGTAWRTIEPPLLAPLLAVLAIALTLSFYILKTPELLLFGQLFLLFGIYEWLTMEPKTTPWWEPAILTVTALGLSHWWQRQKIWTAKGGPTAAQGIYALAIIALLFCWLNPRFEQRGMWLAFTSVLAIGVTIYGLTTRAWFLAAFGQIFLLVSTWEFAAQLTMGKPQWFWPVVPMVVLLGTSFTALRWFQRNPQSSENVSKPILQIAQIYRWTAIVMSLWWVAVYIPKREQIWVLMLPGTLLFLVFGLRRNQEGLLASAIFFGAAGARFLLLAMYGSALIYWPNLAGILVFGALQQFARIRSSRFSLHEHIHTTVMLLSGFFIWVYVSRWVILRSGGAHFFLTVSWTFLALLIFGAGLMLRERIYRWLGLGLLGGALARIVLVDVWKLEMIYRILSFLALGIVLLVLGFVYNKCQDKIKKWI